tara:strand:+ start:1426 stop:1839 length:414 start_codon:yes stop_codon:yes gene_type:complete
MSVKIKAKNASNILQTLTCDNDGKLNTTATLIGHNTKTNLKSVNLTINSTSSAFENDLTSVAYGKCLIWGDSNTHKNIILQFSNNATDWYSNIEIPVIKINNELVFMINLEQPPKHIRFYNPESSAIIVNIFIDLLS